MTCAQCHKEFFGNGILVSADGDFVCSTVCQTKYERERDHFLNVVIHDDVLFEKWLKGEPV
jgi:hypothetical protein